jgi:hypothetical protein
VGGLSYRELFGAFFPLAFSALPVLVVRPPPRWDDDPDLTWLDGEPTETMTPLDEGIEEFSPMPGLD